MNLAPETILGEVRIRFFIRILIGLGLTWFTFYWFSEELISPLASPFLALPLDSYFVHSIGMLPGTCNCDPFVRTKGSFCGNLHEQSSFFDGGQS